MCTSVESYALKSAYEDGVVIPGWKPVIGKGQRSIDQSKWDKSLIRLAGSGFNTRKLTRIQPETLATIRKELGPKGFAALEADGTIYKPPGSPKLVPEVAPGIATRPEDLAREDFA